MSKLKCLSLFSNVGLAETYFEELGIEVVIANELIEERSNFYKHLYPKTEVINGDITDDKVRQLIVKKSLDKKVDFVLATPPCQGMSRHGKRDPYDPRNYLIYYAIDVIKKVNPKFVLLENVPKLLTTKIEVNGENSYILDYLKKELQEKYVFPNDMLFDSSDYGVPQTRKRCIIRLVRKDYSTIEWKTPKKEKHITLRDAIGHLPSLDPLVREEDKRINFPEYEKKKEEGLKISKWFYPPVHSWRQIEWMMHTPSGTTAVYNKKFFPQNSDGRVINARLSCYRRYSWDKPANTITQNNGVISSSVCVHPGRLIKDGNEEERIYSDPRVLTIYELMIVSSLPTDWNIPDWADERLIRNVIGEGIPPLMIKKIMNELIKSL